MRVLLFEKVGFNPFNFTMLLKFGALNFKVLAEPNFTFKSMQDIIEYARINPGKLIGGILQSSTLFIM